MSRPALTSVGLSLASVLIALSTFFIPSVPLTIAVLTVAAILLVATGAALAIVLGPSRSPKGQ